MCMFFVDVRFVKRAVRFTAAALTVAVAATSAHGQSAEPTLTVLNRAGESITGTIDGNEIRAAVTLPQASTSDARVAFRLSDAEQPAAACTIRAGSRSCESPALDTRGWFWSGRIHELRAVIEGNAAPVAVSLDVRPRPVVLVHGFNSNAATWQSYVEPNGFLASIGLRGFAVGDDQAPGVLDTGNAAEPRRRTNTLTRNAAVLAGYVDAVRRMTGAEKIDIVAHSMGGLIARRYIDEFAADGSVAQLITLGTPMAGTACAILPASLGLMLPATIEIQPSYVTGIFNRQVTQRRGSRFRLLAGTPRLSALQSPCAGVPSDLIVSAASVRGIDAAVREMPTLHTNMTSARDVFEDFVAPQLRTPLGAWLPEQTSSDARASERQQFTHVHTGHLNPGDSAQVVIDIEPGVTVATFALYDTSRTLDVVVTGASGKTIALDVEKNGLVRVEDPSTLVYLGYGFQNPKPGKWRVVLATTSKTPAAGADYAITAQFHGGALLDAESDASVIPPGERIAVRAHLSRDGTPLEMRSARAVLRDSDNSTTALNMVIEGSSASIHFVPTKSGVHAVDVEVTGVDPSGVVVERAAFLAFEVEPPASAPWRGFFVIAAVVLVSAAAITGIALLLRRRRH